MRKYVLFVFFLPFAVYSQVSWYGSVASGQVIKEISDFERDEFDYVLSIEHKENIEERILYRKNETVKRWLISHENGVIRLVTYFSPPSVKVSETYYSETGRLEKEVFFKHDGTIDYIWEYAYKGTHLVSKTRYTGADKKKDFSLLYSYDSKGRLSYITDDIGGSEHRYVQIGGRLVEEWHGKGNTGLLIRYREDGRELEREEWRDGVIYSMLTYEYENKELKKSIKIWPSDDKREETFFTDEKPVSSVEYQADFPVKKEEMEYDGNRLVKKIAIQPGKINVYTYVYDGDDLKEERITENSRLIVTREYSNGLLSKEIIILENGTILYREYNKDGEITKEELSSE
ncbi:hypothetical protein WKV44_10110 [Spirochaetia bacterium 38H-sp]|uniref:DUF2963 domain-containing protein n=1 Tax=Rarispira pelagica TaxID=3141764 RepID=A0ABU9UDY6_9SPIR